MTNRVCASPGHSQRLLSMKRCHCFYAHAFYRERSYVVKAAGLHCIESWELEDTTKHVGFSLIQSPTRE